MAQYIYAQFKDTKGPKRPLGDTGLVLNLIYARQFPDNTAPATLNKLVKDNPEVSFELRKVPERQAII